MLKEADFIIGNSSAGVREAPYYKVPTIDIGTRQHNRAQANSIVNVNYAIDEILKSIKTTKQEKSTLIDISEFGEGNSDALFLNLLESNTIWQVDCQKQFQDL